MRFHHKLISSLFRASAIKITHVKQKHIFSNATKKEIESIVFSQFFSGANHHK